MTQFVEKGGIVTTIVFLYGLIGYFSQYLGMPASPETISAMAVGI